VYGDFPWCVPISYSVSVAKGKISYGYFLLNSGDWCVNLTFKVTRLHKKMIDVHSACKHASSRPLL